jgi:hypothetical protein
MRATDRHAVVVTGDGPEQALLEGWLREAGIPVQVPTSTEKALGAQLMEDEGRTDSPWSQEASWLTSQALAWKRNLLVLGTANKTCLLLSPRKPIQAVLPLGDMYASEVWELAGSATVPPILEQRSLEVLRQVDQALEDYYLGESTDSTVFQTLPGDLRDGITEAWNAARKGWHPRPLIPKLGRATLGLDLDP